MIIENAIGVWRYCEHNLNESLLLTIEESKNHTKFVMWRCNTIDTSSVRLIIRLKKYMRYREIL